GAPVPGALVRFHWGRVRLGHHGERLSDHGSSGRTDDRGEFRLSPVLRGTEPGELDVTAEGYLRRRQEFACPEPCSDPTISVWIERECRALGRVVCEDGRPVPEVYVDTDPRSMRPRKGDEVFGDRTNAEGRFEVGGLPSGVAIRLRARTRPSDRDPCLAESAPFPIDHVREAETVVSFGGPGETIDLGDLVLSALTTPFPGSRPAGIGPDERPSSLSFPR
ncbi:MAG: carboxypeptidase-like regulatory domain-containing protein, partial [Planctomycetota bacterium]